MGHEIDLAKGDWMVSGNNQVPWHSIGTVVAGLLTSKECLVQARLAWKTLKTPLFFRDDKGNECVAEDSFATVRSDTNGFLGTVGARYTPIDNESAMDILDPVIGDKASYETAGSLRGGKIVWMLAKVEKEWMIAGDSFRTYCLVYLSHDGKHPVTVRFVTVRVVCANTLAAACNGVKAQVSIRHTRNFAEKIEQAHKILGLQDENTREFKKIMESLAKKKVSESYQWDFVNTLIPSDDRQVKWNDKPQGAERARQDILTLARNGAGNTGKTRYDLINGVTDYVDHSRGQRVHDGATKEEKTKPEYAARRAHAESELRFESSLFTTGAGMKERALEILMN